ncbi:hypothetical protein N7492_003812 [Penicillium capsulatum]|uniref:Rhodopsin domain-containing protein n=1 Tax=Penicillium capsulatum TaxID=69766 RepID=A0A9W9IML0_9EURO|nr:hypothetical protein N7492_003812 [Penicillium capsulatum]
MAFLRRDAPVHSSTPLLRDVWALTGIAIVTVALRIVAKFKIGKLGPDDLLMIFALVSMTFPCSFRFIVSATVGSIMITLGIECGFGRGMQETTAPVAKVIMYDYLAQTFALAGGALGRVSYIVFIERLLGSRLSYKVILWTLVALQGMVNVLFIVIMFVQCPGHMSALWNHPGKEKCWDARVQAYYGYFQGAMNSATDLYLAVFSTCIFWSLNLKLRVKMGLIGLLGLGIFAMIAAIIKTDQTRVLATPNADPTTATVEYDRWLYIETYLVIITASIPCIRSLIRSIRGRPVISRDTHELSSPYGVSSIGTSRMRRRGLSPDRERVMSISEENVSDGDITRSHNEMHESTCPKNYV